MFGAGERLCDVRSPQAANFLAFQDALDRRFTSVSVFRLLALLHFVGQPIRREPDVPWR